MFDKASAATLTAVAVVIGGLVSLVVLTILGTVEANTSVPILAGAIGAATVWMWPRTKSEGDAQEGDQ